MLVAPSLGFESIDADRNVTVETASNPGAQLGLDEAYDETEIRYTTNAWGLPQEDEQAPVANVTNNVGNPVTVSVEVASIQGDEDRAPVLEVSNEDVFIDPMGTGTTRTVELGCSQSIAGSSQDATVELEVDATSDPVSVEDATATIDGIDFVCEGTSGGQAPEDPIPIYDGRISIEIDGTPAAGGYRNSEVTVPIRNAGADSVTITGIHLAEATNGNQVQGIFGAQDLQLTGSQQEGDLNTQSGIDIGQDAPRYDLDQNGTVGSTETATLSMHHFRGGGNGLFNTADMRQETVTVVLMVEGLDVDGREDPVPVEIEFTAQ